MGNHQCCCDESDAKEGLPDGTVMVWRPETVAKRLEPSSAELLRKDRQLDAVMDKIVQLQPTEEHPGPQKVPKAVLDSRHPAHLTQAERCFVERTAAAEAQRSPAALSRDETGSVGGLDDASAASSVLGRDPSPTQMPPMQWVTKYDGEAAPQRKSASKESDVPQPAAKPESGPKRVSVKELLQEKSSAATAAAADAAPAPAPTADAVTAPASPRPPLPAPTPAPAGASKPEEKAEAPAARVPPAKAAASKASPAAPSTPVPQAPPTSTELPPPDARPAPSAAKAEPAQAETEPVYDEADLDVPYVTVQFRLPDGTLHDVYFLTFPFGFDLTKSKPMTVRNVRPGSHAEDLGVEAGWVVLAVGDVDVSNMDAKQLLMVLLEQKKKLDPK